jgi:cyclophilin family peptidyl-prolyl cis-trans isomerase
MTKNYLRLSFLILLLISCGKKNNSVVFTNQNVKEALTQYGKENPENEVVIETTFGNMRIRLYEDTPLHRANFVKLIKENYYDDSEFYRIVNEFVIQGGDLKKTLNYTIPPEFNPKYYHKKGALAMARSDENNPGMESSSSEFYIIQGSKYAACSVDQDAKDEGLVLSPEQRQTYLTLGGGMSLDQKYTVFGEVIEGLDVIDKIASVKVYSGEKPLKKVPFQIHVTEVKK